MEGLNFVNRLIEEMRDESMKLLEAAQYLELALAREAENLLRYDLGRFIDDFKSEIEDKIREVRLKETIAASASQKNKLANSFIGFAIGGLASWMLHPKDDPLLAGIENVNQAFSQSAPFGTVVVAVGPKGILEDVQIISISAYARARFVSESSIRAEFERKGYRLMTPELFSISLDQLKSGILKGGPEPSRKLEVWLRNAHAGSGEL